MKVKQPRERKLTDQEVEAAILSALGRDWTKAGLTVAKIGDLLRVEYAAVAASMIALIQLGTVIWDGGDMSDGQSWVKARVRKTE